MWLKAPAKSCSLAFSRKAVAVSAGGRPNDQDAAHALSGHELGDLGTRGPDGLLSRIGTQRHALCADEGDVRNAGEGEHADLTHEPPRNYRSVILA